MAVYGFTVNADGNVTEVMKKMELALKEMGSTAKIESTKAEGALVGMSHKVGHAFKELKGMILAGLGISAAFAGFEFVKQSKEAFDALEDSVAKLNAALVSTRGIAGRTMEELEEGAKQLSGQVLFGRAQIMDGQSMLLTFTRIRGEIFDKTLPAITNFATRFKMDLPEAANTVGKALNDPLKGLTRLQRQGVVFSEAQKDLIKKFMETGQVAKAQQVILKELETEFGGLAEAMTKTDEGKIAMAKKQWGSIKLTVGEIVSKLEVAMIPVLDAIIKAIKGIGSLFTSTSQKAVAFRTILAGIITVLSVYYARLALVALWTKIYTFYTGLAGVVTEFLGWYALAAAEGMGILEAAQWAFNAAVEANPIGWIITLIVGLIIVVMACWDHFKTFREIIGGVFGFFKSQVMTVVHVFQNFAQIVDDLIHFRFKKAFQDGKKMFKDFKDDVTSNMVDSIKKGADAAGNSEFKFGNLLKFNTGQEGPGKEFGDGKEKGFGAVKDNAFNTSALGGTKGGLGEAKVINIHIDTMQKVTVASGKDLKARGQDAVEVMLRTLNNIAYSQSTQ